MMSDTAPAILLVDDEPTLREPLAEYLSGQGFAVTEAESAAAARAVLTGMNFDLVLLDIMMPGMSGMEVLAEIRRGHAPNELPVIMAKTPASLSHDPARKGRPTGFTVPVRDVRLAAGAGFLYALCGDIMTMPGLPLAPSFLRIDVDATGRVSGLS